MEKRERFLELMNQSSERALTALGGFLGREFGEPGRAREWDLGELEALRSSDDSEVLGLYVNLDGAIGGHLMLLADGGAANELVAPLVRKHTGAERQLWACSALLEAGNVVFSAAAGALGDAVGVVVFPSIPSLFMEGETAFRSSLTGRDGLGVYAVDAECPSDSGAGIRVTLIWVPTQLD